MKWNGHGLVTPNFFSRSIAHHALALEFNGFRASYSSAELTRDYSPYFERYWIGQPVYESREVRINVAGLSYDLSRLVAAESERFIWIVGANYRSSRYAGMWGGKSVYKNWNLEFGTTACWSLIKPTSKLDFIATITGKDMLGENVYNDSYGLRMPKAIRFGGTIRGQSFFDGVWYRSFEWSVAFLHNASSEDSYENIKCTNLGGEVVLSDVLALRVGRDLRIQYYSTEVRYGAGLRTPSWLFENYGLSVDYSWDHDGYEKRLAFGAWANF